MEDHKIFCHQVGSTLIIAAILTGCASTSSVTELENTSDRAASVSHSSDDGTIGIAVYLDGADPGEIIKCKKAATTGSRLKRTICGRAKDDSDLFGVINTGGSYGPGDQPY